MGFTPTTREESEAWFVESLESWRKARGIERFSLVGHSMGGYLSVAYCERFAENVDRLVLVSPVGVPPRKERKEPLPLYIRALLAVLRSAWSNPASLLRLIGPLGSRRLCDGFVRRRFSPDYRYVEGERPDLVDYSEYHYHVLVAPSSGDACLPHILQPGAYAHAPLCDRIPAIRPIANGDIPVRFLYGEKDWMDPRAAVELIKTLPALDGRVHIVKHAGHNLHLQAPDGADGFNAALRAAL